MPSEVIIRFVESPPRAEDMGRRRVFYSTKQCEFIACLLGRRAADLVCRRGRELHLGRAAGIVSEMSTSPSMVSKLHLHVDNLTYHLNSPLDDVSCC